MEERSVVPRVVFNLMLKQYNTRMQTGFVCHRKAVSNAVVNTIVKFWVL